METLPCYSLFKNRLVLASNGKSTIQTFDDFLTVMMAVFTKKPNTGLLYYAEEYAKIVEQYKDPISFDALMKLPEMLFYYIRLNMDEPDLLGEFYMQEISRISGGRYFVPYQFCVEMTKEFCAEATRPVCILDTQIGSGRLLLAFARNTKVRHRYHGIESDPLCVKMAAINMFLHDLPGEVILADNFEPDNFKVGYRVNHAPAGIFRVPDKENSQVWHAYKNVFSKRKEDKDLPQKRLLFF